MEVVISGELGPIAVFLRCPYLASLETWNTLSPQQPLEKRTNSSFQVSSSQMSYLINHPGIIILSLILRTLHFGIYWILPVLQLFWIPWFSSNYYFFFLYQSRVIMYCFLYVTESRKAFFIIGAILHTYLIKSHLFVKPTQILIYFIKTTEHILCSLLSRK